MDAWMLGIEASTVIAVRMWKFASGAGSAAEAHRMVSEKVKASRELQTLALTGGLGLTPERATRKALAHFRRKVRANRRRLSKS